MKILAVAFTTALAIAMSPSFGAAQTQPSGPLSVLKSLLETRNAANANAALALLADDSVIINVVGVKFAGRDNMKKLIQDANAGMDGYEFEVVHSAGDTVTWTALVTNPVYEKLGVAPVHRSDLLIMVHFGVLRAHALDLEPRAGGQRSRLEAAEDLGMG